MSRSFPLRQQWLGNVRGDVLAGIGTSVQWRRWIGWCSNCARGAEVEVAGVNQASDTLIDTLGTHRRDGARLQLGH